MSNKIVPGIYRSVIDEVMAAIKPEFEEYGVSEDVLAELQSKWEHKVIASHVADFETPPAAPHPPQHHPYPTHPMHIMQGAYAAPPYVQQPPPPGGVKTEPVDTRYMLSQPISYALPPLPGPQLNGARQSQQSPQYGGQTSVLSFPPGPPPVQAMPTNGAGVPLGRPYIPPTAAASSSPSAAPATSSTPSTTATPSTAVASSGGGGSGGRIPQLDGPASDDSEEDDTPPPPSYAPRSSHPSLPQPQASTSSNVADSEAINSDLDDDDTGDEEEAEEGGAGETDIVFCTYDKVARVKNKWKCILKDGMIHVNGKDYLFSKCTGEFEW